MRSFLFILIAGLNGACVLSTEPVEQLALSITLSDSVMRGDSGIGVLVEARNLRPVPVRVPIPCGGILRLRVEAPDSEPVLSGFGCRSDDDRSVRVIEPGETIELRITLSPEPQRAGWLRRWPEGIYRVIGVLADEDGRPAKETEPQTFELICSEAQATEC
jgi:hypothetical protein